MGQKIPASLRAINRFMERENNRDYETEEVKLQRIKEVIADGHNTLPETMYKIRMIVNLGNTEDAREWYLRGRNPTRRQRTWEWVQEAMSQAQTPESQMEILLENEYLWPDDLRQTMRLHAQKALGREILG